ncbi:hypothetical protein [Wenxinia saemankumensis]|uniref:5-aminolevulinate synthase n=1 Tax=Wenxinia saemankumensis TaxID=1447782 RepID=A0A1M6GPB0_9RHOB|nr:hypothetical protein [Wenxinia saemankumensis]SHJ11784.1 hypothetical protein SAMN05444417_2840 [Wenxinia saemankumensis]
MASLLSLSPALLLVATSLGYVASTLGMKVVAEGHALPGLVVMGLGFAFAVRAEILLMRSVDLSVVYVAILGLETLVVLAVATGIGEGLGPRQAVGAALILGGLLVVGS